MFRLDFVAPGTVVDGLFRLVREIGRGSYGVVFEAEQLSLGRRVAVKILLPNVAMCSATRERFRREARISSNLWHPQAVHIYHCGFHGAHGQDLPYIAMEYLVGEDLHDVMTRLGRLSSDDTRTLLREALDPLMEAHELGIVHRDLKPENLFLSYGTGGNAPCVKVLDFGIARAMAHNWSGSLMGRLTIRGGICGTPHYMAPELVQGDEPTPAADVYALGCIGYEMLAGHPPFEAATPVQLMMLHCEHPARPLPQNVHAGLRRAIALAMAKSPLERPGDARAFAVVLDEIECDTDEWPLTHMESIHHPTSETLQRVSPPPMPPATVDHEDPNKRQTVTLRRRDRQHTTSTAVLETIQATRKGGNDHSP